MRTLFFIILTITSGCPSSDPVSDACKRADECNALSGSVQECTDNWTSALNAYPETEQEELRHDLEACLDHPSCSAFVACVNALVN